MAIGFRMLRTFDDEVMDSMLRKHLEHMTAAENERLEAESQVFIKMGYTADELVIRASYDGRFDLAMMPKSMLEEREES